MLVRNIHFNSGNMKKSKSLFLSLLFLVSAFYVYGQNQSENEKKLRQQESNKKMVTEFYQELFGNKNPDAINKYIGDKYIQHNPGLPDGKEALLQAVKVWFKDAPKEKVDFQHVAADGDLVWLHVRSKSGQKVRAIVDIFRIENGKIVEHWDVIQEIPEKSASDHPMF
jgi:predicted SnoaL-like aldol condensation-catalyzing enzyme